MMKTSTSLEGRWALILGASSGFGAAAARALACAGMHIFGVHLDSRSTQARADAVRTDIEAAGRQALFFNGNAADSQRRTQMVDAIAQTLHTQEYPAVHVMLHSLAFGSLKPFIAEDPQAAITEAQMDMTLRVMAHSFVYWTQDLLRAGVLSAGSRIFALSSAGAQRVIKPYGAVSAAKAALESHMRQLALELAPLGIAVNCLVPGVADTPASRAIPGAPEMLGQVADRHPAGRLTTPEDVAAVIVALAHPRITWLSGAVIPVDGAESIVG